jgi:beta-glucosidase
MLTLHHFSHPKWFHSTCPWIEPNSVTHFERFVKHISTRLLDRVPLVITLNEPLVWLLGGYGFGKLPPGERDFQKILTGLHNMLLAHRKAYDHIKGIYPQCLIGLAHNLIAFKRAPNGIGLDQKIKSLIHQAYNNMIVEAFQTNRLKIEFPLVIKFDQPIALDDKIDFWGVNYYYRLHVRFKFDLRQPFELLNIVRSSGEGKSDLDWEIYPKGLIKVCNWMEATNKPIIITENGIAAEDDTLRIRFLESHLKALQEIKAENPNVIGYYYWSLLDNYEWLWGTKARFGLYHVDYQNGLTRTLKPSGAFYRDYIKKTWIQPF